MSCASHGRLNLLAAVVVLATVCATAAAPIAFAQHDEPARREMVLYEPPLQTEVIDPFRPPAHIGGAGNRGLEYGDADNRTVAAPAPGRVAFAGLVAGRKVITIEHADGVRTTYTGLLEIWVDQGQTVSLGAAIARASTGFHFGARIREHYLDPQILIDASSGSTRARLIPGSSPET